MKTARGSHISAIIMAALNLLYMAGVTVFWLFNGVVDLNFLSLFIPINGVFLLTSILLLISVCRKKFFTLISLYWLAVFLEQLLVTIYLCLIGFQPEMIVLVLMTACFAAMWIITMLRYKLSYKAIFVGMTVAAVIAEIAEIWLFAVIMPLSIVLTAFYPWMIVAPLLPAASQLLVFAAVNREQEEKAQITL